MYFDVIISGFGGQGILFMGNLLAHAAMLEGKNVTYMPAYGPEMRGGAANCTVVVADEEIGSPVIYHPHTAIVMNRPSLYKFGPRLLRSGLLVVNASLVDPAEVVYKGINLLFVPANDLARETGDDRLGNMAALGALITKTGVVRLQSLVDALSEIIQERYRDLLPVNVRCLEKGAIYVRNLKSQI
ncbi:MAG: 2-oxoacid:acceptor oxidoreductase family protein [Desulfovibrionales bacterium]|nr:2-oxoacid:acceptor oxidoreductase family protein [Desulfovibrionales bacterium]